MSDIYDLTIDDLSSVVKEIPLKSIAGGIADIVIFLGHIAVGLVAILAIYYTISGIVLIKNFKKKRAQEKEREGKHRLALCYVGAGLLIRSGELKEEKVVSTLNSLLYNTHLLTKNYTISNSEKLVSYVANTKVSETYPKEVSDGVEVRNYGRRNNPYWVLFFKGQCVYDPFYDPFYSRRKLFRRLREKYREKKYRRKCREAILIA